MPTIRLITAFMLAVTLSTTYADDKLYIGLDADMSSVAKAGGVAIKRGAELAIEEINNAGGVLGKQLALLVKDHRGNPARGISNLKKFAKNDSLIGVLGGVHTPVVLQELETIHENKLVFLVPWAAGTPITSNEYSPNYVFRASIRDKEAGPVLIKYASESGAKSVALILESTGWGRSNEASMTAAAKEADITITGTHWVNWGAKNIEQQLDKLSIEEPDAVMLVTNAPEGVVLAKGFLNHPVLANTPIISHWGIAGGSFVKGLGLEALNKLTISTIQTFSFINAYDKAISRKVLSRYKAAYDPTANEENIPGVVGFAQAYDLVHLLAKAADNAGNTKSATIRNAMENIRDHTGLVKHYKPPFSTQQHDALLRADYFIATFDQTGNIVPR